MTIEELKAVIDEAVTLYPNAEVLFNVESPEAGDTDFTIDRANLEGEKRKLVLRSV